MTKLCQLCSYLFDPLVYQIKNNHESSVTSLNLFVQMYINEDKLLSFVLPKQAVRFAQHRKRLFSTQC